MDEFWSIDRVKSGLRPQQRILVLSHDKHTLSLVKAHKFHIETVIDSQDVKILREQLQAAQAELEKYKKLAVAVDEGRASILVENADDSIDGGVIYTTIDDALDAIGAAMNEVK